MPADVQSALQQWLSNKEDPDKSFTLGRSLTDILKKQPANPLFTEIIENEDLLGKKSVWIVGGDGWAYDIGFGGLDHVLASGENINVLVLDTECYSNTGGQTSKATPLGAIAKFASIGKRTNKKYLGRMFMTYGNIYVASIALGANKQHAVSTLLEAEAYDGPSIVIAYCPCINHGIKKGMDVNILEEAQAVASGYWSLYRYNPELTKQGKDPLIVDYGKPDGKLEDFLEGEDRYAYLEEVLPDVANELHKELSEDRDNQFTILTDESQIQ